MFGVHTFDLSVMTLDWALILPGGCTNSRFRALSYGVRELLVLDSHYQYSPRDSPDDAKISLNYLPRRGCSERAQEVKLDLYQGLEERGSGVEISQQLGNLATSQNIWPSHLEH